jgi:hypothetical protein
LQQVDMPQKLMLYKILPTDKNKLWWPKLVGQTLSAEQFDEVKFNCFIDIQMVHAFNFPSI